MNEAEEGNTERMGRILPWLTVHAIAMAFLESAVVIYLREHYYPQGFRFPVVPIAHRIAITELWREAATMLMLLAPAALASRRRLVRYALFCFAFGVWDIFYYIFLKVILGWPVSLFDPDILFLVPVLWAGPVLAPCLVSFGLIALGLILTWRRTKDSGFAPRSWHWIALSIAAGTILYTFMEGPLWHVRSTAALTAVTSTTGHLALEPYRDYVPGAFLWPLFLAACALAAAVLLDLALRKAPVHESAL